MFIRLCIILGKKGAFAPFFVVQYVHYLHKLPAGRSFGVFVL